MQSDFEVSCKTARAAIAVPAIPLDAIRRAAHDPSRTPAGRRRRGVLAAVVASMSVVAVAAAAEMFGHTQISLDPSGTAKVYFDGTRGSWRPVRDPKEQDIQKAARAMNFPVVLPNGLPEGTTAAELMVLGPGAMQIAYNLPGVSRRSNHLLFVILANPKSVAPDTSPAPHSKFSLEYGPKKGLGAVRWMVGQEEVILLRSTITAAELAHFKDAMNAHELP